MITLYWFILVWGSKGQKTSSKVIAPQLPGHYPKYFVGVTLKLPPKVIKLWKPAIKTINFWCLSHHFPVSFRWVFSVVSHGGPHLAQVVLPLCIGLQVLIPALAPSCGSGYTNCRGSRRWHADRGDISEQVFFVVYCYHHYYFFVII